MAGFKESLEITLEHGTAEGTLICSLKGWDCEIYRISRDELSAYTNNSKLKECGIYFLVGEHGGVIFATGILLVGVAEFCAATAAQQHRCECRYAKQYVHHFSFHCIKFLINKTMAVCCLLCETQIGDYNN